MTRFNWKLGMVDIEEVDEYKYLGMTIRGIHGDFRSMGDRMKEANKMVGMIKYAAW